jgi:hypothetical protein
MATNGNDAILKIWVLPLIAGLLPVIGALVAFNLSIRLELIPACNPLLNGCVSVSRAARHDLPNYIFRALLLPSAVLQGMTWLLCRDWLISLRAQDRIRLQLLPWLGMVAAIFLVCYGSFLGTEGSAYRWLRRYGTIVYFGFTYLCMLIASGEIRRLARATQALAKWRLDLALSGLCVFILLLGLSNVMLAPIFDADAKNRIENVAEWWLGISFTLYFLVIAVLWRCTRFALQARTIR